MLHQQTQQVWRLRRWLAVALALACAGSGLGAIIDLALLLGVQQVVTLLSEVDTIGLTPQVEGRGRACTLEAAYRVVTMTGS